MQDHSEESIEERNARWLRKLTQEPYDLDYWLSKTVNERLEAGELLRQFVYGYDPATARMEKTIEVIQQPWSSDPRADKPTQRGEEST